MKLFEVRFAACTFISLWRIVPKLFISFFIILKSFYFKNLTNFARIAFRYKSSWFQTVNMTKCKSFHKNNYMFYLNFLYVCYKRCVSNLNHSSMLWNCINVFTKQFLPKENHSTWATDTTASNSYRFIRKRPWIPRSELEVNLSKLCLMVNQTLTVVELQTRCRILMSCFCYMWHI